MSDALGELLVRENLMTPAQLKTALEFQKSLGGDLRNIVVKLGYVKDSVLAGLVAQEEHVSASAELTPQMIDFETVKVLQPRGLLDKYQVVPLRGEDASSVVLAMADPNDLRAIEEVQFVVNRAVEPAVATKSAIRKTLNQMHELLKQHESQKGPRNTIPADRLRALQELPLERLLRAYVISQIEAGRVSVDDLIARANRL